MKNNKLECHSKLLGKSLREVVDPRNPSRSSPYYVDNYFTGLIHSTLVTTIHVTSFPPYRHLGPQGSALRGGYCYIPYFPIFLMNISIYIMITNHH
jgi:hypothetical protein